MFHISMYIVGITMLLYGKVFQSIEVLEWLNKTLTTEDELLRISTLVNLEGLYLKVMEDCVNSRKDTKLWIVYSEKSLSINPKNQNALSCLAFFYYIDGQKDKSEQTIEKQIKLYPRYPSTEVNVAFLRMMQKDYRAWFHWYERLTQNKKLDFNPIQVVNFLGEQYELRKEVGLLYGSGVISFFYWDKQIAKEDLNKFIKLFSKYPPQDGVALDERP